MERPILDLSPVQADGMDLVVLDDHGVLIGIDRRTGEQRMLCQVAVPPVHDPQVPATVPPQRGPLAPERARLHVSGDGTVAARSRRRAIEVDGSTLRVRPLP